MAMVVDSLIIALNDEEYEWLNKRSYFYGESISKTARRIIAWYGNGDCEIHYDDIQSALLVTDTKDYAVRLTRFEKNYVRNEGIRIFGVKSKMKIVFRAMIEHFLKLERWGLSD